MSIGLDVVSHGRTRRTVRPALGFTIVTLRPTFCSLPWCTAYSDTYTASSSRIKHQQLSLNMGAAQSTTSSALIAPMITTTATLGSVIPTVVTTLQNTETAIPTTLITKAISSSISSLAPAYTSVALPKATSPPKYLFVYGDSYTSSGFSIAGTKPAIGNPLGNPSVSTLHSMAVALGCELASAGSVMLIYHIVPRLNFDRRRATELAG